ncbi:MAG: serine/threonine-protein kinase PknK [Bacteroidetes bacterium]|nr:serine/threonine-protein kinase PknK [Bacteroidota bacterium]
MNPFDGYLIPEDFFSEPVLIQNKKKHIFRATSKSTGITVALKRARTSDGLLAEASKLSHEYTILKNLDHPNIPKAYELISSGKLITLVVEWFEAETLKERITQRNISLDEFFDIAISMAETLKYVHELSIIHRDVNPANILITKDRQIKLIDFGISTDIHSEQNDKLNLDLIEGTLVYMAPEQTGRTSYTITESCDLYALGIVFYEILAGKPPFDSVDPLEVIHFHLSRKPIFLQKTNPNLPFGICAVIDKLLEKNPDDRYQSEDGLLADLRILKEHHKNGVSTDQFVVATKNQFKRYRETQKLYGREGDVQTLLKSFEGLNKSNSSLVLISGYAGIGKSALVKQIQQPIVEKKAIFISGKFDQFKRNIPYFSFIEAFNDLIKSILSESDDKINYWKNQLTIVLGENGGLITELIPNLEMIIGKQAPIAKLQPAEHEFRFRTVMLDFIYAFSSPGSPLVIFLDDLHWADLPSLNLIERILITSETDKVLILGTYRDNEVTEFHPLRMTIQQLKSNSIEVTEIALNQLNEQTTIQIVADSFEMELAEANELGILTYKKTNGNPFFINRFLKSLFADKYIVYANGKWHWDKTTIDGLAYADNVIDLMSREIANLPIATREAMKMAAVLGNTFQLNQLALLMGQSQYEIFETLHPALKAGYLVPIDRNYRNISLTHEESMLNGKETERVLSSFRFMHDRVQQAAYSLISDSDKDKVHLQTGRILLKNTAPEKLSDAAFDITGHFTNSLYLVTNSEEKKSLAKLFLLAGHKAKDSTSYDLAVIYLSNALKLNADSSWSGDYEMTFDIYITLGESEFLDNDHEKALYYFGELLKYAKTI